MKLQAVAAAAAVVLLATSTSWALERNHAIRPGWATTSATSGPDPDSARRGVPPLGLQLLPDEAIIRSNLTPGHCPVKYAGAVYSVYRSPADFMGQLFITPKLVLCDGNNQPFLDDTGEPLKLYAEVHVNGRAIGRAIDEETPRVVSSPELGTFIPGRLENLHSVSLVVVRLPEQNATVVAEVLDYCLKGGSPIVFTPRAKQWEGEIEAYGICAMTDPALGF